MGTLGAARRPSITPSLMRSFVLVFLQAALMVAITVPFDALAWNAVASVLVAVALALGVWTLTANRPGNFNVRPEPKADGVLVTGGPYRHVRHPMYLALLVAMAGFCIGYGTPWRWVALAALAGVIVIKAGIEERAMTARHPGYATYAQRTKRLIPFVW